MATSDDAAAVAAVYLPYVRDTAISFETQQPSVEEMRSRLTTTLATLPWLVITDGPRVKGYAYASPHRAREAYRWSGTYRCTWTHRYTAKDKDAGCIPRC